ncbi:molybdopterin-dependent oxidoreductase [Stappia stellulata]|uniref:molybdopterin-dependent oxidoreductase n=1 Tax=Stappia stellulata TaxID=71235 RepID=UPI00048D08EF|nr:molybdopterin-dependent oxidoreductase [Stappia stellulata]
MKNLRLICAAMLLLGSVLAGAARAEGEVVLTVDGRIAGGAPVDFTLGDLRALGVERVETTTPWHDGTMVFEGVLLSKLMTHVGAKGDNLTAIALNDFYTEIPLSDAVDYGVILAYRANGADLTVRDKGPLFVIYPFDRFSGLRNELYFSRSIWQLRRLTVK